jgi:hypothetical protein
MIKVLTDNVILAITITASMFSVQDIHDYLANNTTIPEIWHSNN